MAGLIDVMTEACIGRRSIQAPRPIETRQRLLALRFAAVRHLTDGAGGFFLIRIRCNFGRSPSSRSLLITFASRINHFNFASIS
jgi:hypothetical protein